MTPEKIALYWLVFGAILMILEIVLPGLVVLFLGMGACLVGVAVYFGWLTGWMSIMTSWFVVSLVLIIGLRSVFQKIMPGDHSYDEYDEDEEAKGTVVEVIVGIEVGGEGRVHFRGTTWQAKSDTAIAKGAKARLVRRHNLVWYVEPAD